MKEITFEEVEIDQKFWFADLSRPDCSFPFYKVDDKRYRPKYPELVGFKEPVDFPEGEKVCISDGVNESLCEFVSEG
jgi:hypothetical protein